MRSMKVVINAEKNNITHQHGLCIFSAMSYMYQHVSQMKSLFCFHDNTVTFRYSVLALNHKTMTNRFIFVFFGKIGSQIKPDICFN